MPSYHLKPSVEEHPVISELGGPGRGIRSSRALLLTYQVPGQPWPHKTLPHTQNSSVAPASGVTGLGKSIVGVGIRVSVHVNEKGDQYGDILNKMMLTLYTCIDITYISRLFPAGSNLFSPMIICSFCLLLEKSEQYNVLLIWGQTDSLGNDTDISGVLLFVLKQGLM